MVYHRRLLPERRRSVGGREITGKDLSSNVIVVSRQKLQRSVLCEQSLHIHIYVNIIKVYVPVYHVTYYNILEYCII
jgi:hypothetical protein